MLRLRLAKGLKLLPMEELKMGGIADLDLQSKVWHRHTHKEKMEKHENRQVAEKIIGSFLGHSCQVRCVFEPEDNHMLREALKMGAKIVDVEEK